MRANDTQIIDNGWDGFQTQIIWDRAYGAYGDRMGQKGFGGRIRREIDLDFFD